MRKRQKIYYNLLKESPIHISLIVFRVITSSSKFESSELGYDIYSKTWSYL